MNGLLNKYFWYSPWGEALKEQKANVNPNHFSTPYKFNGKELDEETSLYYYGARYYNPQVSVWLGVDPHAENYPNLSPYTFVANNPIMLVDPDGKDFVIWYEEDGRSKSFVFNGKNAINAPDNEYVKNFIKAYEYNISNGGGDILYTLANSSEYKINIEYGYFSKSSGINTIYWNDLQGLETDNGSFLSPATVLEHEADHTLSKNTNIEKHRERVKTPDPAFSNAEEKRVIKGSEQKTARANNEIGQNEVTRNSHGNSYWIITTGPTSNKIDRSKTYDFYLMIQRKTPHDVTKGINRYKP